MASTPTTSSSTSPTPPLDFAALLSREYLPARVAQLVPKERAETLVVKRASFDLTVVASGLDKTATTASMLGADGDGQQAQDEMSTSSNSNSNSNKNKNSNKNNTTKKKDKHHSKALHEYSEDQPISNSTNVINEVKQDVEEETSRLVLQLVSKTPTLFRAFM